MLLLKQDLDEDDYRSLKEATSNENCLKSEKPLFLIKKTHDYHRIQL